jgi:hypothetical protein
MRKTIVVAVATFGVAAMGAAPAHAARDYPGTPGEKSCFGQTLAHTAQEVRVHTSNYEGLGGYLRYQREFGLDWTMEDVRAEARWWCSGAGL